MTANTVPMPCAYICAFSYKTLLIRWTIPKTVNRGSQTTRPAHTKSSIARTLLIEHPKPDTPTTIAATYIIRKTNPRRLNFVIVLFRSLCPLCSLWLNLSPLARRMRRELPLSVSSLHLLLSLAAAGRITRTARLDSAARDCPPGRFHRLFHG